MEQFGHFDQKFIFPIKNWTFEHFFIFWISKMFQISGSNIVKEHNTQQLELIFPIIRSFRKLSWSLKIILKSFRPEKFLCTTNLNADQNLSYQPQLHLELKVCIDFDLKKNICKSFIKYLTTYTFIQDLHSARKKNREGKFEDIGGDKGNGVKGVIDRSASLSSLFLKL